MAAPLHLESIQRSQSTGSEFVKFQASMRLPLAPVWMADGSAGGEAGSGGIEGVRQVLAGWVMRYLPPLQCVLLSFSPTPVFAHPTSSFPSSASPFPPPRSHHLSLRSPAPDDEDTKMQEPVPEEGEPMSKIKVLPMVVGSGFALPIVHFSGLGWRPTVGRMILGSPTLSTPSHVSLLLHNLFNATVPASHIPSDEWTFDPEYIVPEPIRARQKLSFPSAPTVVPSAEEVAEVEHEHIEGEEEVEIDEDERAARQEVEEEERYAERGWWVSVKTGEPLGGREGVVEFTIVSLTIANSMITVTGSLLSNPFDASIPSQNTIRASSKNGLVNAADAVRRHTTDLHNKKRKALAHELGEDDDEEGEEGGGASDSSRSPSPPAQVPRVKEEVPSAVEQVEEGKEKKKKDKKEKKDKKRRKE